MTLRVHFTTRHPIRFSLFSLLVNMATFSVTLIHTAGMLRLMGNVVLSLNEARKNTFICENIELQMSLVDECDWLTADQLTQQ